MVRTSSYSTSSGRTSRGQVRKRRQILILGKHRCVKQEITIGIQNDYGNDYPDIWSYVWTEIKKWVNNIDRDLGSLEF